MIFFAIFIVVLAIIIELRSSSKDIEQVKPDYFPSKNVVEPDERFDTVITLKNSGRRFIPFLRLCESLPEEFEVYADNRHIMLGMGGEKRVESTTFLRPKEKAERRVSVSLKKRGRYFLRNLTMYSGDFLGLREDISSFSKFNEIVVLPRPAQSQKIDSVLGGFMGDISASRFIFEDPVLTLGFREYTGREPLKTVSWTQSARTGSLMVKKYDYTLEPSVTVLLNIETTANDETTDDTIERCYSIARSVCSKLEDKGIRYAFSTNAAAAGALSGWSDVSEGLGTRHFYGILEGLGRATYYNKFSYNELLRRSFENKNGTSGKIIITPDASVVPPMMAKLREASNGNVLIIGANDISWEDSKEGQNADDHCA